jgi:hypothetical protein
MTVEEAEIYLVVMPVYIALIVLIRGGCKLLKVMQSGRLDK